MILNIVPLLSMLRPGYTTERNGEPTRLSRFVAFFQPDNTRYEEAVPFCGSSAPSATSRPALPQRGLPKRYQIGKLSKTYSLALFQKGSKVSSIFRGVAVLLLIL